MSATTFFVDTIESDDPLARPYRITRCAHRTENDALAALAAAPNQHFRDFESAQAEVHARLDARMQRLAAGLRQCQYNLEHLELLYRQPDTLEGDLQASFESIVAGFGCARLLRTPFEAGRIRVRARGRGAWTLFTVTLASTGCPMAFDQASCSVVVQAMQHVGYRVTRHFGCRGNTVLVLLARLT